MMIGYNYHPSRQGCAYWQQGDFSEIERDLSRMAEEGVDVVRFFLFWRDFEPEPGRYSEQAFQLLYRMVKTARDYRLRVIPSLLTIWMNGQTFDLPWRGGRCLWSDPYMIERAACYVTKVASILRSLGNVYAYDIGDELIYVDARAVKELTGEQAESWLKKMVAAVRRGDESAQVMMAHDHTALTGNHVFRAGLVSRICDKLAVHGFPLWAPFPLPSNESWPASLYVPFLTRLASAYANPLLDEFGLYGGSEEIRADHVRTSGTSALLHGAEGLVAWCWQDFVSCESPYDQRPGERFVGFYTAKGIAKPSASALLECRTYARLAAEGAPVSPQVAIYVPEAEQAGADSESTESGRASRALFHAFLLLVRLHVPTAFVRDQLEKYRVVIVPCLAQLTRKDLERMRAFVRAGGTLLYTPGSYLHGFGGEELFGVELQDFTRDPGLQDRFHWRGRSYPIHWRQAGFDQIPVVRAGEAEVLSRYRRSLAPALTRHRLGKGTAYYLNAPFELMIQAFGWQDEPYRYLYMELLKDAEALPKVFFTSPEVELHRFVTADSERCFLINHANRPVSGMLVFADGRDEPVTLAKKSVKCVNKRRV
ncbi:MAG: beta-galactosidase trimerization domain-containing protein [Brevibacillus sp.]|nr:beta-galactosidase trimerization domain-containing protein [Brevibacillus sp.]